MSSGESGAFRSLRNYNFRVWSAGAVISNLGAWMQRIAQDWLVLTHLTHHDATTVGIVTALQFGPQLLLLSWTGSAVDRLDRRKLLFATQGGMGALAFGLGLLTIAGATHVWHVYLFAALLGCIAAFDAPVRQVFAADMVGEADLPNAVALNAALFNVSRLVGPALAGLLLAAVGPGWAFMVNAASFLAVLVSLSLMRTGDLHTHDRAANTDLADGLRYVANRPDLRMLCAMVAVFGTFGLQFPIFISTMAVTTFRLGASGFGLLSSAMAAGSVAGALLAARRERLSLPLIAAAAALFGTGYAAAAAAPSATFFGLALVIVGIASQTVTTSTTSFVQQSTDPSMRGRVVTLLLAIALGGQPIGAPLVGFIANTLGPRWAVGVGALSGLFTAAIGVRHAWLHRGGAGMGGTARDQPSVRSAIARKR